MIREFLLDLEEEFGRVNNKILKVVELKRIKQGNKIIKEFVWKFRRVAKRSGYKGRLLIEEFKRGMNRMNRKKLIETEYL